MEKIRSVPLREDYYALTEDTYSALILQQMVYWSERVRDFDKFIDEEKERSGEELSIAKTHGWVYKSAEELKQECMLDCSSKTVRRRLETLVKKGYLEERDNPVKSFDRAKQYRVNLIKIARELADLGYPMSGYRYDIDALLKHDDSDGHEDASTGHSVESIGQDVQSMGRGVAAIPEITTETTIETTSYTERSDERPSVDPPKIEAKRSVKKRGIEDEVYRSEDYLEDGKHFGSSKTDAQKLIEYYLLQILERHKVNAFIRKTEFTKFVVSANRLMRVIGGLESAKQYVDWFLSDTGFYQEQGFALELLMSSSAQRKYVANKNKTVRPKMMKNMTKGVVDDEDRDSVQGMRM